MVNNYYNNFIKLLKREDKDQALFFILDLLEKGLLTIEEVYSTMLSPSLSDFACNLDDPEICVWKEHTRSSIIRTILEATYPYVVKRKPEVKSENQKVIVVCPQEEYHEIGAIMVSNYFSMAGFKSQYIGANTPKNEVLSAIKALKPNYVAISVTNYYNLVITKKITEAIKTDFPDVKIIIGGQAFRQKGALNNFVYDYHLDTIEEIFALAGAVL